MTIGVSNILPFRRGPIQQNLIPETEPDLVTARLLSAFLSRMRVASHMEAGLRDALQYLLEHPGSMVRPRIVYQIASAFGLEEEASVDMAMALEYFHTASLVFDDLPSMDDATMRRGVPCVHIQFSESTAILAALALVNRAYALVWSAIATCEPEFRQPAMEYLEQHLGVGGLLNGQSLDLNYSKLPHTLDSTVRVAQGKTVSLISLTLVLPALTGGASSRELQLLHRISTSWGLSYQIVDDLKDVLETSSSSGKTAARDQSLGRPNTALTIGVGAAVQRLVRLLHIGDVSLDKLVKLRPSLAFLASFRRTLKDELDRTVASAGVIPIESIR